MKDYYVTARARRLRIARKAIGYTKSKMARALGIDRRLYLAYEAGAPVPPQTLDAICSITRCSPAYFHTGKGFELHKVVYHHAGIVSTRLNLCGAPCHLSRCWCVEACRDGD